MSNRKPNLGDTVFYYENAVNAEPCVALVTQVYSDYLVNLVAFIDQRPTSKMSIHHSECDPVKNNPMIARNFGVWKFREDVFKARDEAEKKALAQKTTVKA